MKNHTPSELVLSALFLAVGLILPFFTGNIRTIGNLLLPMHLPVLLCGLVCGKYYGAAIGFLLPPLRSLLFGMPIFYPSAIAMAFELATYGFTVGLLYERFPQKNLSSVFGSLAVSMLTGRLVWGAAMTVLTGLSGKAFSLALFWTNGFVKAIPGVILQFILIPPLFSVIKTIRKKKRSNEKKA